MSGTAFKDRLAHDPIRGEWMDQNRRYMMLRPDALMGLFRNLPDGAQAQALDALEASIFTQGGDSARAYLAIGGSGAALLTTIAETSPALGWGRWTFAQSGRTLHLDVTNSPFAAGFGPSPTPVCHAIKGMVRAVSGLVLGAETIVVETHCVATGAATCRFDARPNS